MTAVRDTESTGEVKVLWAAESGDLLREPVTCTGTTPGQFAYTLATPTSPTTVDCNGSTKVVLTFAADQLGGGTLAYTQADAVTARLADLDANHAKSSDSKSVPPGPP